jgi:uncharacterized protein (DUF433 family)
MDLTTIIEVRAGVRSGKPCFRAHNLERQLGPLRAGSPVPVVAAVDQCGT